MFREQECNPYFFVTFLFDQGFWEQVCKPIVARADHREDGDLGELRLGDLRAGVQPGFHRHMLLLARNRPEEGAGLQDLLSEIGRMYPFGDVVREADQVFCGR